MLDIVIYLSIALAITLVLLIFSAVQTVRAMKSLRSLSHAIAEMAQVATGAVREKGSGPVFGPCLACNLDQLIDYAQAAIKLMTTGRRLLNQISIEQAKKENMS